MKVAGSLKLGKVQPTQLIKTLQRGGKPTMLGKSIGEFGRIYKAQYLLAYLDDEDYRSKILQKTTCYCKLLQKTTCYRKLLQKIT